MLFMPKHQSSLKPVFVTGTPRSGTTLLYRTLLKHPSFKPASLCLEETHLFARPHSAIRSTKRPNSLFHYMLDAEAVYNQYLQSIKPEIRWQKVCKKLRLSLFIRNDETYWQILKNQSVICKYFNHAKEARGCARIVEKTPRHIHFIKRIRTTFPGSKIIITMRHPVDVYASYLKRRKKDPDNSWLKITVEEFVKNYRKMCEISHSMSTSNQAFSLKYEDFVQNPDYHFEQICSYIEEPFLKELLNEGEPELKDYKIDPLLAKPITVKVKDWNEFVTVDQAAFIENRLQMEMDVLEYHSKLR